MYKLTLYSRGSPYNTVLVHSCMYAILPSIAAITFVMIRKRDLMGRTLLLISVAANTIKQN